MNLLNRFQQFAVQHKLSASAILLWQALYFAMAQHKQFVHFQQNTATLVKQLGISRQGLLLARKRLQQVGLLAVQMDENHKLCYTLQLDGKALQDSTGESRQNDADNAADEKPCAAAKQQTAPAKQMASQPITINAATTPQQKAASSARPVTAWIAPKAADDVVLNQAYNRYLKTFCDAYGDIRLWTELGSWMKLRVQNGWTLTAWGLEELLRKLLQLAERDVTKMVEIVKQSIRRRWKGFHPLRVQSRPYGEKLLKLEEQERRAEERRAQQQPNRGQNFRSKQRDLSVLEL